MSAETPRADSLVVLAGGRNTRLGPLSGTIYKPFIAVNGLSFIAKHVVRARTAGVGRIVIVTDHRDPLNGVYIEGLRADAPATDLEIELVHVEGTMEAKIIAAATWLGGSPPVIVVLGDSYALYDPTELAEAAGGAVFDSAIAVAEYHLPFGVVEVSGESVVDFREKPGTGYLVNCGQMALGARALELLTSGTTLVDTLEALAGDRSLAAVEVASEFVTLDSLVDLGSLAVESQGTGREEI